MPTSLNGWPVLPVYPVTSFVAPGGKHVYVTNRAVAVIFDVTTRRGGK